MIKITNQDGSHQYDIQGRAITTWDNKKCTWIVNTEFENKEIDWWGKDNDFPRGETLTSFVARKPNWDKLPNIVVTWVWNTEKSFRRAFGYGNYVMPTEFPYKYTRSWGYLEYDKEEALTLKNFAEHGQKADNTIVTYNGEEIFNGKVY